MKFHSTTRYYNNICIKDVPELCCIREGPWASELHQNEDLWYPVFSRSRPRSQGKVYQWNRDVLDDISRTNGAYLEDLEDVSESDHAHNSSKRIEDTNEDNVNQIVDLVEPPLTIPTFGSKGIIWTILIVKLWHNI